MRVTATLVFVIACGKAPSPPAEAGPPTTATVATSAVASATAAPPKPPWPTEAPNPNAACKKHEECAVTNEDAILPSDPCCYQRAGAMPVTRAYLEFTTRYRTQHCQGVKCEPLPFPGAQTAACAKIGRCVNRKCILGCDDPTLPKDTTSRSPESP